MLRRFVIALAALLCAAAANADVIQGRDYRLLTAPQPPSTESGKIEVIEFFSFGCPACNMLQPIINRWETKLPEDVVLTRVPVGLKNPAWELYARTFYALESLGEIDRLDDTLFSAIHEQKLPLTDERKVTEWVKTQGVDAAKFSAAFRSFTVNTKLARAEQLVKQYKVFQVPTVTVAGRYVVVGANARSYDDWLKIADQLIAKAKSGS